MRRSSKDYIHFLADWKQVESLVSDLVSDTIVCAGLRQARDFLSKTWSKTCHIATIRDSDLY